MVSDIHHIGTDPEQSTPSAGRGTSYNNNNRTSEGLDHHHCRHLESVVNAHTGRKELGHHKLELSMKDRPKIII
jgi:hypothetical protein